MVYFSKRWYFQSISDFPILRLKIGGKSDKVDGKSGGNLREKKYDPSEWSEIIFSNSED